MAVEFITDFIIRNGAKDTLALLPSHERMLWRITTKLQDLLVVGRDDTRELLASQSDDADGMS